MAALDDIANELTGYVPGLPQIEARNLASRAYRDICDEARWSFQVAETDLLAPPLLNAGTVSVTQLTNIVRPDAAAAAAFNGPLYPFLTTRQFRVSGGPIYNILSWDTTINEMALDKLYIGPTNATAQYQIYTCYFIVPTGFRQWISVKDQVNGYRIQQRNLHRKRQELDRRDPQRSAAGLPYWLVANRMNAFGQPVYELWPHPIQTSLQAYQCLYYRKGELLGSRDDLPEVITSSLLIERTKFHAYEWAASNNKPGTNWLSLRQASMALYKTMLRASIARDQELYTNDFGAYEEDTGMSGPIDAGFLQSHDLYYLGD
jgi:hypothetical protein